MISSCYLSTLSVIAIVADEKHQPEWTTASICCTRFDCSIPIVLIYCRHRPKRQTIELCGRRYEIHQGFVVVRTYYRNRCRRKTPACEVDLKHLSHTSLLHMVRAAARSGDTATETHLACAIVSFVDRNRRRTE